MKDAQDEMTTAWALGELTAEEQAGLGWETRQLAEVEAIRKFGRELSEALIHEPTPEPSTSGPPSSDGLRSGTLQAFRARPRTEPESVGRFRYAIHRMRLDRMAASTGIRWGLPLAASLAIGIAIGRYWPRGNQPITQVVPVTAVAPVQAPVANPPPLTPIDFTFQSPAVPPSYFHTDWASYNWAGYGPYHPAPLVPPAMPAIQRSAPANAQVYNLLLVHKAGEELPPRADRHLLDPNSNAAQSLISIPAPRLDLRDRNPPREPEPAPPPAREP